MNIPVRSSAELNVHLTQLMSHYRTPFTGTFELTQRCNFNCPHCYLGNGNPSKSPLSLKQITDILDQLAHAGCLSIAFTGGEPLIRDDYREIHQTAHRMGFLIRLFTNGYWINDNIADFLAAFPPHAVEISMYGADPETCNRITGVPDTYERVSSAVDRLLNRQLRVVLKAVLMDSVIQHISPLQEFAAARGLQLQYDPNITPTLEGDPEPTQYRGDPARAVDIEFSHPDVRPRMIQYHREMTQSDITDREARCGAGFHGFHINHNGDLMRCLMLPEPAFSLQKMNFDDAWRKMADLGRVDFLPGTECFNCTKMHICGCCPGALYCEQEHASDAKNYYCAVATERVKRIINPNEQ